MKILKYILICFYTLIFYFMFSINNELKIITQGYELKVMLIIYSASIIILFIALLDKPNLINNMLHIDKPNLINNILHNNFILFLLIIWCAISLIFTDSSGVKVFIKLMGMYSFGTLFCIIFKENIFKLCLFSITVYQLIAAILFFINRNIVYYYDGSNFYYRGIFSNKNVVGMVSCVAIIFSFYYLAKSITKLEKMIYCSLLVLNIISLYFSKSKTSILCVVMVLLILIIENSWKKNFNKQAILFYIFILLITFNLSIILYFYFTDSNSIMGSTLTGRTYTWNYCLNMLKDKLLYGYGYLDFWNEDLGRVFYLKSWEGSLEVREKIMECHNGFFQLLTETGLIGLLIYISSLINRFKQMTRNKNQYLPEYILIAIIILSFTESMGFIFNTWIMLLLIFIFNYDIASEKNFFSK